MSMKLSSRHLSISVIFSLLGVIMMISFLSSENTKESDLGGQLSSVDSSENIPLSEISGSYLFHNKRDKKDYIYTIGDASSQIAVSAIDLKKKKIISTTFLDIKDKILNKFGMCHSTKVKSCREIEKLLTTQWEGIYVDPKKKIFLLNEALATILIYDEEAEEITQVINLDRFTMEKTNKDAPNNLDENALGEGFLPLNNGHVLVIKENFPPSLVEFGLKGEKPEGFDDNLLIDEEKPFPISYFRSDLEPLAVWHLPSSMDHCDLSELAYSKEGGLNILSQKCQIILELKELTTQKKTLEFKNFYRFPQQITEAEAFILLPGRGEFLIFEDKKNSGDKNLHFFSSKKQEKFF